MVNLLGQQFMRRFTLAAVVLFAACTKNEQAAKAPAGEAVQAEAASADEDAGGDVSAVDSVNLEPAAPVAGAMVTAKVVDPGNRLLAFTWYVDNAEVSGEHDDRLDGKYVKKGGRIKVRVTPRAGDGLGESTDSDEITVGNSPPKITGFDLVSSDNNRLVFKTRTDDIDGDNLIFRLVAGPPGMTVAGDGTVEWTAPADFAGGVTFTVGASDGQSEYMLESSIGSR